MKRVKLAEVVKVLESGARPKGGISSETGTIPSLGAEHLSEDGGFNFHKNKFVTLDFFTNLNSGKIKSNDILIVKDGATTGKVSFVQNDFPFENAAINEHVFRIAVDPKNGFSKYVYFFLRSSEGKKQILNDFRGATVGGISRQFIESTKIPLPPLNDQIRIATVLTRAEKLIAKRKESIKTLDELLKSTFLEMFGDPVRNEKGWERDSLKNLCGFITKGTTPKAKDIFDVFDNQLVPFIKVYHISNDGSINFNYNPAFITQKTHMEYLKRSIVYPNDILMNIVGPPLGKIGLVPNIFQEWNVNQAIAIFRCGENLNPKYLVFALKSSNFCNAIINMAVGIRQLNLSLEQCREINIPVPPQPLQNQFAAIVEKVEVLKARYTQSLTELENLYGSLSQRAFKGKLNLSRVPERMGNDGVDGQNI